jgi:NADH dehydrogenase (ubiquinone) 1 alpha subcomplex subunit 9
VMQYQRNPLMTPDLVAQWSESVIPRMTVEEYRAQTDDKNKILTMEDLGIVPVPIEKEAFAYLQAYRFGGHFHRVAGYH